MHLTSTINPLSKSEGNVSVSVFCYNGERRFLRVSESYEETTQRVSKSFKIATPEFLVLQTSTLDVCKGNPVVVDSSAYPLLWSVLDEINVVVLEHEVQNQPEVGISSKAGKGKVPAEEFPSPATTPAPVAGPSRDGATRVPEDVQPTPPMSNSSSAEDEPREVAELVNDLLQDWESEIQQEQGEEPPFEEEVTENPKPPSPKLQKKFKATPVTPDARPVKKAKEVSKAAAQDVTPRAESSTRANASANRPVRAKEEDNHFELTITGPESVNAQFKLRGRNKVKKVLSAACKTFDLDPERARLVLFVEMEEENGEVDGHEFPCPLEDTIALCGINVDSKLFVVLDEPYSEEDIEEAVDELE